MRARSRVCVALLFAAVAPGCSSSSGALEIGITYSRFTPPTIRVAADSSVTFTVRNDDPIAHEFIIGTRAEQAAHERGTEKTHDGAPGAASLDPGETATISFDFGDRGTLEFACHIPGHYRYGMRGTIEVF